MDNIEYMANNFFKFNKNSPFYRDLINMATIYIKNIVQEFINSDLINYNYHFTYDFYNNRTYEELRIYFLDYKNLDYTIMFNHEKKHYEVYYYYNKKSNSTIYDKNNYTNIIPDIQLFLKNIK